MSKYDPEWTIDVLKDLGAFFKANEMQVSSERTDLLIATVMTEINEKSRPASFKTESLP